MNCRTLALGLLTLVVACSDTSTPDDDDTAGAAGSAGMAGNGGGAGAAGMPPLATAGTSSELDGGESPEVDAGAVTEPEMPGNGLPFGCPTPSPVGVRGQTIAIRSVNFLSRLVVIQNISNRPQTIGGRAWQWCQFPSYWHITNTDVVLQPGDTLGFRPNLRGDYTQPLTIERSGQELAIYISDQSYTEPSLMRAFVAWADGSPVTGREGVAFEGGYWTLGDRVEIVPGAAGFVATGDTSQGDGYTAVPGPCLAYDGPIADNIVQGRPTEDPYQ